MLKKSDLNNGLLQEELQRDSALHKCGMNWRLKPLKIRSKLGEIIP
jgi:hypothetical protein